MMLTWTMSGARTLWPCMHTLAVACKCTYCGLQVCRCATVQCSDNEQKRRGRGCGLVLLNSNSLPCVNVNLLITANMTVSTVKILDERLQQNSQCQHKPQWECNCKWSKYVPNKSNNHSHVQEEACCQILNDKTGQHSSLSSVQM